MYKFLKFAAVFLSVLLVISLAACGESEIVEAVEETAAPSPTPTPIPVDENNGCIRISEVVCSNDAIYYDSDSGSFPDYIELENCSDHDVNIGGWSISDDTSLGWKLPGRIIKPGQFFLVFCDYGNSFYPTLHADFSLLCGETISLFDSVGTISCSVVTTEEVMALNEDEVFERSFYPTPGCENTKEGYAALQEKNTPAGALEIYEVMTTNHTLSKYNYYDWVEIKNVSSEAVNLSDYYLSDNTSDLKRVRLPKYTLAVGRSVLVLCTGEDNGYGSNLYVPFALDNNSESLILSDDEGISDYVWLRNVSFDGSIGRMDEENGFFYFEEASPSKTNTDGCRFIAAMPSADVMGGVFAEDETVSVKLTADGEIHYTVDGTAPTLESPVYEDPIEMTETTVLRAVNCVEGEQNSRCLDLTYIFGEDTELSIVCVNTDSEKEFDYMYAKGKKYTELCGTISYYGESCEFFTPCSVKLAGATSLKLPKKNITVKFGDEHGLGLYDCDIFGDEPPYPTALTLRSGQDQFYANLRDELGSALCMEATDCVPTQRYEYCVVYVNGVYYGIYAIKEKINDSFYATVAGGSKDDVTIIDNTNYDNSQFYTQVVEFSLNNDMSLAENYKHIRSILDINSLIDWVILEGYSANYDLGNGNLRYVQCANQKWQLILYDMDCAYRDKNYAFRNIVGSSTKAKLISPLFFALFDNADFRAQLIDRFIELTDTVLTDENVLKNIDMLADEMRSEMPDNVKRWKMGSYDWERQLENLREKFDGTWTENAKVQFVNLLNLTEEEQAKIYKKNDDISY